MLFRSTRTFSTSPLGSGDRRGSEPQPRPHGASRSRASLQGSPQLGRHTGSGRGSGPDTESNSARLPHQRAEDRGPPQRPPACRLHFQKPSPHSHPGPARTDSEATAGRRAGRCSPGGPGKTGEPGEQGCSGSRSFCLSVLLASPEPLGLFSTFCCPTARQPAQPAQRSGQQLASLAERRQEHKSPVPATVTDPPGLLDLSVQPEDAALEDPTSFLLPSKPVYLVL